MSFVVDEYDYDHHEAFSCGKKREKICQISQATTNVCRRQQLYLLAPVFYVILNFRIYICHGRLTVPPIYYILT